MAEVKESGTPKKINKNVLFVIAGIAAVIAIIVYAPRPAEKLDPSYYTGPKHNFRNGLFIDGNGKVVPPPPGVKIPEKIEFNNTMKDTE